MKCIIAGSRTITDYEIVKSAILESKFEIDEIICGTANGVDKLGEQYGKKYNIPITYFSPDWDDLDVGKCIIGINKYGKKYNKLAGHIRNEKMCGYAKFHYGGLILIWDGKSKGSAHMLSIAENAGLIIYNKIIF